VSAQSKPILRLVFRFLTCTTGEPVDLSGYFRKLKIKATKSHHEQAQEKVVALVAHKPGNR